MVITDVADRIPESIHRLIYWNALVPNSGESLNSMVSQMYVDLFAQLKKRMVRLNFHIRSGESLL
jgi:hypothetical protein